MPFDAGSGLAFDEVVVHKESHRMPPLTRCLGRRPRYVPPEKGSESLYSKAMRKLLRSLNKIDATTLSNVPSLLLEKIWQAVTRSQLDSLYVWRLFVKSSVGQHSTLLSRKTLRLGAFDELIPLANDPTCAWVTNLTIKDSETTADRLVSVSQLENLRRFNMSPARLNCSGSGFNDRIFRSWAELARDHGAFKSLESVFLYSQEGVSQWSLDHLNAFPALDEFCAYRCKIKKRESKSIPGWRLCPEDSLFGFIESSKAYTQRRYTSAASQTWDSLLADYLISRAAASEDSIDSRPVLDVIITRRHESHEFNHIDEMVCLKRGPRKMGTDVASAAASTRSAKPDGAPPPIKKRRLALGSTALDEML